jgi:hypothetical protein
MRPDESEFFSQVLEKVEDLPEGLRERLLKIIEGFPEALEANEQRADALRRAIEEGSRD